MAVEAGRFLSKLLDRMAQTNPERPHIQSLFDNNQAYLNKRGEISPGESLKLGINPLKRDLSVLNLSTKRAVNALRDSGISKVDQLFALEDILLDTTIPHINIDRLGKSSIVEVGQKLKAYLVDDSISDDDKNVRENAIREISKFRTFGFSPKARLALVTKLGIATLAELSKIPSEKLKILNLDDKWTFRVLDKSLIEEITKKKG